tara:strand:+ start:536 stop:937 length:402 start_codon:yes stop_codon:yes gene_type:complete
MTIPTQAEYEANEFALYQRQIKQIDAQPVAVKREAMTEYTVKLNDAEWLANSVNLILAQNYGFWVGKIANEIAQNKRMNRCAWLAQHVALFDHNCPQSYAAKAWKALPKKQQSKVTKAIQAEIDCHNQNREAE